MYKGYGRFGLLLLCMLFLSPVCIAQKPVTDYRSLFKQAEKLATANNPTNETDQQAIIAYRKVISILKNQGTDNLLLFNTYVATGAFLQVLDRQQEAIPYFKLAFALKKNLPGIKDSVLFRPLVYCGNSYYRLDKLDSAQLLYKQAEQIAERNPTVSELERLYNTLGVIAYSTGDYTKSITYYAGAVTTLTKQKHPDKALLVTYMNNQAMAYRRLNKYQETLNIYKQLLPYGIETDKLLHNMGAVYLAIGESKTAISYLLKVNYEDQKKLNDLGLAYLKQGQPDVAYGYLEKASVLNKKLHGTARNSDQAVTLKYMGDVWVTRHQPLKALTCYQQAINYLLFDFNSADIYTDPASFNSAFYTTELMETLLAKAEAFTLLYSTSHRVKDLDASLQTFLSFYRLTGFIEQFYESDDARMFISIKKNASHRQPIALCLQLFKLTGNKKYIEQAFLLDEQNKANTLALYLQENKLKASSNISASLLAEESYLKRSITAIVLKASGIANMKVLTRLKDTLNQYTVRLIKVQDKINNHTRLKKLNLGGNSISITELQKIIPGDGIILSYHIGDKEILGFAVTKDEFNFFSKPVDQDFQPSLQELYKLAQLAEGNNNRTVKSLSANLYRQLIQPAETWLKGKTNLIIIPDDELNYLPFELLTDNKGANLLSHYSITYNYSCTLLHQKTGNIQYSETKKLGMAPFNGKIPEGNWVQLSSSKQEIESVNGTMLLNRQATKQHFLQQAHNYGIIHLATHAYANDHDPNRSFIAFYPEGKVMDHELFLPEIYNLKLDKTRLIILSACQTGTGELVKGEGLMSLSRAFSYAGCDNIITSSWMANDNATAYIASRLHYYLQKNYGIAHALQQAKTDYLQDESIPATLKKPAYWAHLRLIGGFETEATTNWVGYAGFVIGLIVLILIVQISRNRVKRPRPGA